MSAFAPIRTFRASGSPFHDSRDPGLILRALRGTNSGILSVSYEQPEDLRGNRIQSGRAFY